MAGDCLSHRPSTASRGDDTTALIGLDVGTTNVKAVVFDVHGIVLTRASRRQIVSQPRHGWAEYDAETLFATAADTIAQALAALPQPRRVAGMAVSSMAETAVALDRDRRAIRPAIAWHDERAEDQAVWWRREVGDDVVASITGLPIVPIFGVHKLTWLREHEPEAFARIDCWLNVADYVAFRLTGRAATDHSLGARLMLMDLTTLDWSPDLLSACKLNADLFAELVPSGTPVGRVHTEGSAATGLPVGTPVAAGGMDHPCAALALGIRRPGDFLDSLGTSESIFSVIPAHHSDPEFTRMGYQQGPHVAPGTYYCNGGMYTAGACVDWLHALAFSESDGYDAMIDAAESVPPGAGGVHFLPHLRMANTPIDDERSRGAFVGLSVDTHRSHLARAVFEGLAFGSRASFDVLIEQLGLTVERVRAAGGGTRNPLLMRIKAALLPRDITLEVVEFEEAASLGAALLAGVGAGVYADVEEASGAVNLKTRSIARPSQALVDFYERAFHEVHERLYPQVAPLSHAIIELGSP